MLSSILEITLGLLYGIEGAAPDPGRYRDIKPRIWHALHMLHRIVCLGKFAVIILLVVTASGGEAH